MYGVSEYRRGYYGALSDMMEALAQNKRDYDTRVYTDESIKTLLIYWVIARVKPQKGIRNARTK